MSDEAATWISRLPNLSADPLRRACQIAQAALHEIVASKELTDNLNDKALAAYDELRDALSFTKAPTRH